MFENVLKERERESLVGNFLFLGTDNKTIRIRNEANGKNLPNI